MHISNIDASFTGALESILVSFKIASSKVSILTAHLSDERSKVETRNEELQTILTSLVFDNLPESETCKTYNSLNWEDTQSDAIILGGDLNYRVYTPLSKVKPMLQANR